MRRVRARNTGSGHNREQNFVGTPCIYLASSSPRRRELLKQLAIDFSLVIPDVPEKREPAEAPLLYVRRVAADKARAGLAMTRQSQGQTLPVLGADTAVVVGDEVLGKPTDLEDAQRMLARLSGRDHQVITAVAVADERRCLVRDQTSIVSIAALDAAAIQAYCQTEEPFGKAGAYAIQGLAAAFVSHLQGSFSCVMGLPLFETVVLLGEFGVSGLDSIAALFDRSSA
jgi:septum formation protein